VASAPNYSYAFFASPKQGTMLFPNVVNLLCRTSFSSAIPSDIAPYDPALLRSSYLGSCLVRRGSTVLHVEF